MQPGDRRATSPRLWYLCCYETWNRSDVAAAFEGLAVSIDGDVDGDVDGIADGEE